MKKDRILNNMEPVGVLKYFEDLTRIPRESGNEKEAADYLVNFAQTYGLKWYRDSYDNVVIKKPASAGYENHPGVMLQAHVDMVCEKNEGVEFDFATEPIRFVVEGDRIIAKETTLGADDGIGVAMGLAVLADGDLEHPQIELICTTDEERGMTGIENFDFSVLEGTYLINLDHDCEGVFCVGCAGGPTVKVELPIEREPIGENKKIVDIFVRGLLGGHSGEDIDKGRGNANKLLVRFLMEVEKTIGMDLVDINGGVKYNAIPRSAEATIGLDPEKLEEFEQLVVKYRDIYKSEYRVHDSGIDLAYEVHKGEVTEKLSHESKYRLLDYVNFSETGVIRMDMDYPKYVESSVSLGVVKLEKDWAEIWILTRSSRESQYTEMFNKIVRLAEMQHGSCQVMSNCPEWEYNPESKLAETVNRIYEKMYGSKPEMTILHAGIEAGEFAKHMGGKVDMIAMGPNAGNLHAPGEYLEIASTKRVWDFLKEVLKAL